MLPLILNKQPKTQLLMCSNACDEVTHFKFCIYETQKSKNLRKKHYCFIFASNKKNPSLYIKGYNMPKYNFLAEISFNRGVKRENFLQIFRIEIPFGKSYIWNLLYRKYPITRMGLPGTGHYDVTKADQWRSYISRTIYHIELEHTLF